MGRTVCLSLALACMMTASACAPHVRDEPVVVSQEPPVDSQELGRYVALLRIKGYCTHQVQRKIAGDPYDAVYTVPGLDHRPVDVSRPYYVAYRIEACTEAIRRTQRMR